jgi:putative phage-type endonuclease
VTYEVVCTNENREAWLEGRRLGLGASDMPAVLGVGFCDPAEVWAKKRGLIADDLDEYEFVQWGLRLEPVIIAAYSEPRYSGRPAERAGELLRSIMHPWALCTLDAWTVHPEHGRIPLEVKKSSEFAAEDWNDGPPETYYVQVQHQMLVTGAKHASIACLIGGQRLVWCDVERDEATIARIVLEGSRMWGYIERGETPPVDGTAGYARMIRALHPEETPGAVVSLDEAQRFWQRELEETSAIIKLAEAREQRAKNEIATLIGDAEEGRFVDGSGWTFKRQVRAGYTVAPSETRVLRASKAPKTTKRKAA